MADLFKVCVQFELSRGRGAAPRTRGERQARRRARMVCEGAVGFYTGWRGGRWRKAGEVGAVM